MLCRTLQRLLKRIEQLRASGGTYRLQRARGRHDLHPAAALGCGHNFKLFVRQGMSGQISRAVDPIAMSSAKKFTVAGLVGRASPDGKYVVLRSVEGTAAKGLATECSHRSADGGILAGKNHSQHRERRNPPWLDERPAAFLSPQLTGGRWPRPKR